MSKTELIIVVIAIALIGIAFLFFSGTIGGKDKNAQANIAIWGTLPAQYIDAAIIAVHDARKNVSLTYREIRPATYEAEIINALAAGKGPDVWLMPHTFILKHEDKVLPITDALFPPRRFRETFVDGAALFLQTKSAVGLPFVVDPLVLYWNRDLFRNAGIAAAPQTWDEFFTASERLTVRDGSAFRQSGTAMGEFNNVPHAKDILSLLVLQTGNPIVDPSSRAVTFLEKGDLPIAPAVSAFRFFTDFSNPRKNSYSWNSAQMGAKELFIGGKLAMYIGYASEFSDIVEKNRHLDLEISGVPQVRDGRIRASFAAIYALALSPTTQDRDGAWRAIQLLTDKNIVKTFSERGNLPPVRKDLLSEGTTDPIRSVFYRSAIQSRSWLEPDAAIIDTLFGDAVRSINSGKKIIEQAVSDLDRQLKALIVPFSENQ